MENVLEQRVEMGFAPQAGVEVAPPPPVAPVLESRPEARNVYEERQEAISRLERLAVFVSSRVGTPGFFLMVLGWTVCWLLYNAPFGPARPRFDPGPAFVLWLFLSNMVQIFLMPLIMVAQNLDAKHSEELARKDYELDQHAALVQDTLLQHMEYQTAVLDRVLVLLERGGNG